MYWPTALDKTSDLIDFAVIKGLNKSFFKIKLSLGLSSDHTLIIMKFTGKPINLTNMLIT